MTTPKAKSVPTKQVLDAAKEESIKFQEHYLWLHEQMPPRFFAQLASLAPAFFSSLPRLCGGHRSEISGNSAAAACHEYFLHGAREKQKALRQALVCIVPTEQYLLCILLRLVSALSHLYHINMSSTPWLFVTRSEPAKPLEGTKGGGVPVHGNC